MTPRSKRYFKFKSAFRLIGTAAGRKWLADKGLHPLPFTVSGTHLPASQGQGYMIDKKGNIVGSTRIYPKIYPVRWIEPDPKTPPVSHQVVREGVYDWKFTFGNGSRTMLALSKLLNPTNN